MTRVNSIKDIGLVYEQMHTNSQGVAEEKNKQNT